MEKHTVKRNLLYMVLLLSMLALFTACGKNAKMPSAQSFTSVLESYGYPVAYSQENMEYCERKGYLATACYQAQGSNYNYVFIEFESAEDASEFFALESKSLENAVTIENTNTAENGGWSIYWVQGSFKRLLSRIENYYGVVALKDNIVVIGNTTANYSEKLSDIFADLGVNTSALL